MHDNTVNGEVPEFTGSQAASLARKFDNNVKDAAKAHVNKQHEEQCREKLRSLAVQGKIFNLQPLKVQIFSGKAIYMT